MKGEKMTNEPTEASLIQSIHVKISEMESTIKMIEDSLAKTQALVKELHDWFLNGFI